MVANKKNWKKLGVGGALSLTLALVMVLTLLPTTALAAESGSCGKDGGDNLKWTLDDNGLLTISGTGEMCDYDDSEAGFYIFMNPDVNMAPWVKYTSKVSGSTVEPIHSSNVKTAVIEKGVTKIGTSAFSNCDKMTEITIPDSVTVIADFAFYACENLTNVYYTGTEAQWKAINISQKSQVGPGNNSPLFQAAVHYNSTGAGGTMPAETVGGFTDVAKSSPYADAILWAVEKNITKGTTDTTFSPNKPCEYNHILTFLWRANGSPTPTIENPFPASKGVDPSKDFGKAAIWAYEKELMSTGAMYMYSGDSACKRSDAVTYLWKLAGSPQAPAVSFTDVPEDWGEIYSAVCWAVQQGITKGTSATTFEPNAACTRGQIVTFLYRAMK